MSFESVIRKTAAILNVLEEPGNHSGEVASLKDQLQSIERRIQLLEQNREKDDKLRHEEIIISTWKKIVDTQMHFNDMVMRVRNLAITLLLAAFGAAAYSLQTPLFLNVYGKPVHVALFIIVFGLVGWVALWIMDLGHFHRLLRGAVSHGMALERQYENMPTLSGLLGMTTAISRESRQLWGWRITAGKKIGAFYTVVFLVGLCFCWATLNYVHKDDFAAKAKEDTIKVITEAPKEIILKIDAPIISIEDKRKVPNVRSQSIIKGAQNVVPTAQQDGK
jgi:hypothetical protein